MIFILNKKEVMVGVLNNGTPSSCPYYNDNHIENISTGVHLYEFEVPANHETAEKLEVNGYVIIRDLDRKFQMFQIKEIVEYAGEYSYEKKIYTEHVAIPDLLGQAVRPVSLASSTLENTMNHILNGTGYVLGDIEFTESKDVIFEDFVTVLEAIHHVLELYDAEIQFEVVFVDGKITNRLVHVTKQRGRITMKNFTYRKDLGDVNRTENTEGLVTALIGVGKGDTSGKRVTLSNFSGTLASGYTKPHSADWVGNDESLQLFGKNGKHIFGIYIDDEATTQQILLDRTVKELAKRCKPKVTYSMDVTLLETITGYESEKVRVGDTVIVKDTTFVPELVVEARVLEITRSYSNPEDDAVVLGDYRPIKLISSNHIQKIQSKIATNEEMWNSALNSTEVQSKIDTTVNPVKTDVTNLDTKKASKVELQGIKIGGYNYIRNSEFKNGFKYFTVYGSPSSVNVTDLTGFAKGMYAVNTTASHNGVQILNLVANPKNWTNRKMNLSAFMKYNNVVQGANSWEKFNAGIYYQILKKDGTKAWIYPPMLITTTGTNTTWTRYTQSITFDGGYESANMVEILEVRMKIWLENCTGEIWVTGVQLEEGDYTTQYKPAVTDAEDYSDNTLAPVESRVTTAESNISKNANEITLRVTKTEFNNLKIGGSNLLYNSTGKILNSVNEADGWQSGTLVETVDNKSSLTVKTASTTEVTKKSSSQIKVKPSTKYSVRALIKGTANAKGFDIYFLGKSSTSTASYDFIHHMTGTLNTSKLTEMFWTFTTEATEEEGFIRIDNNGSSDGITSTVWFSEVQIEEGDKHTAWTPSHQDFEKDISVLESSITQNANNIELKVSKDGVISSINQTPETVTIQAGKIHLDGHVTTKHIDATNGISANVIKGGTIDGNNVNVANTLNVGNQINLGTGTSTDLKMMKFKDSATVSSPSGSSSDIHISALNFSATDGYVWLGYPNDVYDVHLEGNARLKKALQFVNSTGGKEWSFHSIGSVLEIRHNGVTVYRFEQDGTNIREGWITPTLLNGWVDYNTTSFHGAGYFKDHDTHVHIKGLVKSGTIGSPIFTLPVGYRPKLSLLHSTISYNTSYALGRLDVRANGDVILQSGGNAFASINCSFLAEQ